MMVCDLCPSGCHSSTLHSSPSGSLLPCKQGCARSMLTAERGLLGNLGPPFLNHPCEAHDDDSSLDSVFYPSSRAFYIQLCPQIL